MPAYAASKEEQQARFAEKVKASVLRFGTGEPARVKVKLRDKTKLEGYISVWPGILDIATPGALRIVAGGPQTTGSSSKSHRHAEGVQEVWHPSGVRTL